MNNQPIVSIDIETTGLDPDFCQILEIGAVIDFDSKTPIEDLPKFQSYIIYGEVKGEYYALNMNSKILEEISNLSEEQQSEYDEFNIIDTFAGFLQKNLPKNTKKYTVAGKNYTNFDRRFLEKISGFSSIIQPMLSHRTLDPGNLFWIPEEDGFILPDTKKCLKRAGLKPSNLHRALDDATDVIRLIRSKIHTMQELQGVY